MNAQLVKVGGSLALQPHKLRDLCKKLSEASKKTPLVMVPGGGEFADIVRILDKRFSLSCGTTHRMAILGMDQYGLLLADLTPNSVTVDSLEAMKKTVARGKVPIFLPSTLLLQKDPLENSWDVTSDSIAIYIARQLQISKVLFVTDVDGIFREDPKGNADANLIANLTAKELLAMDKRTSVDKFAPKLLQRWRMNCFVVNGLFPERVEAVLAGQHYVVCSKITTESGSF